MVGNLYGCGDNGEHKNKETEEAESAVPKCSDEIVLDAAKVKRLGIVADSVRYTTFEQVIKVSGEIMPAQGSSELIVAKSAGIVHFKSGINIGVGVAKGMVIASVSGKGVSGGDPTSEAAIAYKNAKAELERLTPLYEEKLVNAKDYREAKQNFEMAENAFLGTTAGSSAIGTITGVIDNILVENGAYVEAGTPIASISANRRLTLCAYLPQTYMDKVYSLNSANFVLPYSDKVYSLREMNGRRLTSSTGVAISNGYVKLNYEFDNNGKVVPGSFVDVYLLGEKRMATIVPVSALTEEQGEIYVYVQMHENAYVKREVKVGGSDGINVEILSGVAQGELVVVNGVIAVRLSSATAVIPSGHSH